MECALDLFSADPEQQRDEYHAEQPCVFHQQIAGHDEEILFNGGQNNTLDDGKGDGCGGQDDAGALLHELFCPEAFRHEHPDGYDVQYDGQQPVECNGHEQADNHSGIPLRFQVS